MSENVEHTVIVDDEPIATTINLNEAVVDQVIDTGIAPIIEENEIIPVQIDPVIENKPTENIENTARKKQNVIQDYNINSSNKLESGDELTLPANFDKETKVVLEDLPNISLIDSDDARKWGQAVSDGLEYTSFQETFVPALEEEGAEFKHKVEHAGINLSAAAPKFKPAENQNLKGERAVIRLNTHLGLGTLFQTPLWHSGLWITFKPPTESEIIELNRVLISDKVRFGRYTYGLAFSNTSSYTVDRLVDFALAHVYDTSAKAEDISLDNLKNFISCQDIPSLLWGFICTMYPRGFKYTRGCINDPEKCNFILEETLNVSKLQWTNTNALNDWQKTFMSNRQSKTRDIASINRYKEELKKIQKKRIELNKDAPNAIFVTIKTPTISEYIEAGHRWISNITETVEKAIGNDVSENERNNIIIRHGQASAMRQYSHWIDSIEYDTNIIDDRDTIETVIETLSSDDEIRNEFMTTVVDYINKSTISIIGIPVFDCPNCGKSQESHLELPAHTNIIPLDVMQVFFGLMSQRLTRLVDR